MTSGRHTPADVLVSARERWLELAVREAEALPGARVGFVTALRESGRQALARRGLPTPRDDDWKYTRVDAVAALPLVRAVARPGASLPRSQLVGADVGLGPRLVFVNGRLDAGASSLGELPRGVRVMSLVKALAEIPEALEPVLGRVARSDVHGFAALNAALFGDGAVVLVEPGVSVAEPVHLVFAGVPAGPELAAVRNVVAAGEGSAVSIVEHFVSADAATYLASAVTEVEVAPGATVTHYRLEEEARTAFHVGSVEARVARDGRLASYLIVTGGRLARSDVRVVLAAEGAECKLNGLYMPAGEQHLDCFTAIEHQKPHGTSQQLYKGVLADHGRGVWTGRILVAEKAQKTSALQTNRNLLLSQAAHVDTRPQLEIYADDVKCSHGAAVGRLDADALFYLRSRGIDVAAARQLLTYAFVSEVLEDMPHRALKLGLERALAAGLLGSGEVAG